MFSFDWPQIYKHTRELSYIKNIQTCDIWTGQYGEGGRLTATLSEQFQYLIVHLVGVGEIDSVQRVREQVVDYRGSAGRGQLFVPAHPLQEDLLVSQAQEVSQTAIERDVPSYTSQAEILKSLHHVYLS